MLKISGNISWSFIGLLSCVHEQRKIPKLSQFVCSPILAVCTLPFSEKILSRLVELV